MKASGEIRSKVCSAVMDEETCAECESWDGVELALDDHRVELPNPLCTCAEGCRCIWTFVHVDEEPSLVTSQRKPPR
jgi:hypothetical protein